MVTWENTRILTICAMMFLFEMICKNIYTRLCIYQLFTIFMHNTLVKNNIFYSKFLLIYCPFGLNINQVHIIFIIFALVNYIRDQISYTTSSTKSTLYHCFCFQHNHFWPCCGEACHRFCFVTNNQIFTAFIIWTFYLTKICWTP
jgi:hypothetical protein